MRRCVLLSLPSSEALLELLFVLLLGFRVLAMCPPMCSCSRSHRDVDCSWRGLRQLPNGLQHNMLSLNLSHNRFQNLNDQLTSYTHLRHLDLSHNQLSQLPTGLPRSLWHLYGAFNRLQLLDKNDTVYQWNLQTLDLSNNKLERAIFINNTMINLCELNLSHNHFWTLPTNMPTHLETIDVSHNLLVKVLPGSLDRLLRLTQFYLHANRFSTLPFGVLDQLTSLRVITLGNNPWACHLYADISYLLSWSQHTPARVLGCPCHTQPVCGGLRPGRTGGWHFASNNQPPLAASAQDLGSMPSEASATGWWYLFVSSPSTLHTPIETWNALHYPFTATPISISTLPPKSTGIHLTINHLSESVGQVAVERLFHTRSHLIPDIKDVSSTDSFHSTQSPFSDATFITQTSIREDVTLATDRFFMTESASIQTKMTTTLHTRGVRMQNQSLPSGLIIIISSSSPAACSSFSLLSFLSWSFCVSFCKKSSE